MPFVEQVPRPYTRDGIEWLYPNQQGVYGILRGNEWVYVGRGDLRARLLDHYNGDNPCIVRATPTHFVTEVHPAPEWREKELILELTPSCNQRVG